MSIVITETRIKLMEANDERLQAFCSITFNDAFAVRDLKIIEGSKGMFVSMPSRKLMDRCPSCSTKNHLRARFCNQCGGRLDEDRAIRDREGSARLFTDIAHPIVSGFRDLLQGVVLEDFNEEKKLAKQPGYVCRYNSYDEVDETPLKARDDESPILK